MIKLGIYNNRLIVKIVDGNRKYNIDEESRKIMKTIIPLVVKKSEVKKLAIIPFLKNPDQIYNAFELQYLDGNLTGSGYRVIGYRYDKYVDVYDDSSLMFNDNEAFDVCENGLNKHVTIKFKKAHMAKLNNCELIMFHFIDIENREISFLIKERSKRKTKPMNLLAPIGYGSKEPNFLPVFFMYNFDFIRRRKTIVNCTIDGKKVKVDKFMFPMSNQFRYFIRYSNECQLFEFASTESKEVIEANVLDNIYKNEDIEYIFDDDKALKNIRVIFPDGNIDINFYPSINIYKNQTGEFKIMPKEVQGYIAGEYVVKKEESRLFLELKPNKGWKSVPNSFISKMILKPESIFCSWCKNYNFIEEIDLETNKVEARWENKNIEKSNI